jgi:DNA polymerase-1
MTTATTTPIILPRERDTDPIVYVPEVGEDPWTGIRDVLAHHGPRGLVGLDVETTGVDWSDLLRTVQFGTPTHAIVLDVENDPLHAEAAKAVLAMKELWFTAHNGAFDANVLHRSGYVSITDLMSRMIDTMVLAVLNEPPQKFEGDGGRPVAKMDLKSLAGDLLGEAYSPDAKKELQASWRKNKWTVSGAIETRGWAQCDVHSEEFQRYAAADVIDGSRLAETLLPLVEAEVGAEVIQREHNLLVLCGEMQSRGYRVDREAVEPVVAAEEAKIVQLDMQLAELGVHEPTKNRVVAAAIEAETGVTLPLTDKGEKSVDQLTLSGITNSRIVPVLLERRSVSKGAGTYLSSWMELSSTDGRLHPSINSLKAATGRFSMSDPSLQNVPASLREYILADLGHVLVTADFSSVEMRIGAGYAGDAGLIADFVNGIDPYKLIAWATYHPHDPDDSNVTKAERQRAKAILLGRMYGRSAKSLAYQEDISEEEAQGVMDFIYARYPNLSRFSKSLEQSVKMGLTRHTLPSGRAVVVDPTWARKAMNYLVQGTGRELMVDAGFRLCDAGYRDQLWISIHDEWIVQVPEDRAEATAQHMAEVMSTTFRGVPIVAEAHVLGAKWGK